MSDLPYTLRQGAIALSEDSSLNWVQDALREAAYFIEIQEVALSEARHLLTNWAVVERERLEREAATPESGLPHV